MLYVVSNLKVKYILLFCNSIHLYISILCYVDLVMFSDSVFLCNSVHVSDIRGGESGHVAVFICGE